MPKTSESSSPRAVTLRGPHSRFIQEEVSRKNGSILGAPSGLRADGTALAGPQLTLLWVDDRLHEIDRWLRMIEERFGDAASTQVAQTAAQALEILARGPVAVVLTEYRLPDADGLGLVASITARHPEVATILVTSQGSEAVAANALKFGARDYLVKSELDANTLHRSILQAASKASLDREQAWRLQQLEQSRHEMDHFVRSLSHDMTAMFMLLDHSFQRLKDAADPVAPQATIANAIVERPAAELPPTPPADPRANAIAPLTQQFAHVEACLRESKRFLDDLTTVARTGTVQMEPSRVELSMAIEEVLFEQRELLDERGVRVDVEADLPAVWCNPCRVKQVLTNLVRNAVRHGCDAKVPRITIARHPSAASSSAAPADAGFEWIGIHDNGSGIPVESREEVFERGRRLAGAHPDGSGMGLSIVRKIVQHYGGQVFVAPESGAGTTFVLSLPRATRAD
jgi:signal transduction histidine kinase